MKTIRFGLVFLMCAAVLVCCSCQARVPSSPQAVETPLPAQESPQAPAEAPMDVTPEAPTDVIPEAPATLAPPSLAPVSSTTAPIGYQEAVEAVLAKHVNALPLKCSLDYDDGLLLYEVEVLGGDGVVYEVQVDAADGTLMRTVADDDPSKYTASMVTIPYTQAVSTAMDSLGQCTFDSFEIDTNNAGIIVYQVDLLDAQKWEQEIEVDAATGAIVAGAQTAPNQAANVGAAQAPNNAVPAPAATHHQERHHDETLAENMVINMGTQATRQFAVCSRCGQYPCVCSSSGNGNQVCGTCHQNPCICNQGAAAAGVSAACSTCHQSPCICNSGSGSVSVRSVCGTCHKSPCVCGSGSTSSGSRGYSGHHNYSGHHSGHHSRHHG